MMPPRFDLYSAWIDPAFYGWALAFAAALFALVYSIRRYLELKNSGDPGEDDVPLQEESFAAVPEEAAAPAEDEIPDGDKTLVVPPPFQPELAEAGSEDQPPYEAPQETADAGAYENAYAEEPEPVQEPVEEPVQEPAAAVGDPRDNNRAENFVRGIYEGISDLDERMKTIESALSKSHVNNDFTVKFLEDVLQDFDSLEKDKIRARIKYLLSDLKK